MDPETGKTEREARIMQQEDGCLCRYKAQPRSEQAQRELQSRLNRMIGQMNGIKKMIEDNRYCGDVLNQIAAVESALQSLGYMILQDHMHTCVTEQIRAGETQGIDEVMALIRKLK